MKRSTGLLALLLAGCGAGASSAPPPAAHVCDCKVCADVGSDVRADLSSRPELGDNEVNWAVSELSASCADDQWSAAAIHCVIDAGADHLDACRDHFAPAVADYLEGRLAQILAGDGDDYGDPDGLVRRRSTVRR